MKNVYLLYHRKFGLISCYGSKLHLLDAIDVLISQFNVNASNIYYEKHDLF